MTARVLMVQGTASGVGKSFVVAALCRIFARRGGRVLPFKAQNISNNAAVTRSGGEIGRAPALQARAAGVEPDVRMHPGLVKPLGHARADVVVLGRFRGDAALLTSGRAELRERTGVPVLGVIPLLPNLLPEEDAATLGARGAGRVAIAAVCFPHVANFDDLDPLASEPGVAVRWVEGPEGLQDAAAIVLPGRRNTLADLRWLWETGLGAAVRARAAAGLPVVGLCGGYQMLRPQVTHPPRIQP